MITDKFGIPIFDYVDIINVINSGNIDILNKLQCFHSDEIDKFNQSAKLFETDILNIYKEPNITIDELDKKLQSEWLMIPDEYNQINVLEFLLNKCNNEQEISRIKEEYIEYEDRDMITLLKFLIFLVDFMKENDIVWGIGRGSSVASFILYKIGIHKVDSLKYQLEWKEFLK